MQTLGLIGFLGGIGLFLFGMDVMTAALREMAADRLRRWLSRFTATPLRGLMTGALATAVVQSSSAVTVMTIGFVGAGLITFAQTLGILYGASIGTTATGWIVALLGVKLKLGQIALPALFIASLAGIFGRASAARLGRLVAGISLLFIGLDMMQASAQGVQGWITPENLPPDTWPGRLALVAIGLVVTMILQSSSAGVATALVLLGSQAITLPQAAALVIGMHLGTTVTGLLAALGGSRAMKMTAYAHTLFHLASGVLALGLLGLGFVDAIMAVTAAPTTALVLFHTAFNLLGALLFLPLTSRFATFVQGLVPETGAALTVALDPMLLGDEGAALDAADTTARLIQAEVAGALRAATAPVADLRPLAALPARIDPAIEALTRWLADLHVAPDHTANRDRFVALLHLTDHLKRLTARAEERPKIAAVALEPALRRPAVALFAAMVRDAPAPRMDRLRHLIDARSVRYRRSTLLREHAGMLDVRQMLALTDAMRWLERVADHAERIAHYRAAAAHGLNANGPPDGAGR